MPDQKLEVRGGPLLYLNEFSSRQTRMVVHPTGECRDLDFLVALESSPGHDQGLEASVSSPVK